MKLISFVLLFVTLPAMAGGMGDVSDWVLRVTHSTRNRVTHEVSAPTHEYLTCDIRGEGSVHITGFSDNINDACVLETRKDWGKVMHHALVFIKSGNNGEFLPRMRYRDFGSPVVHRYRTMLWGVEPSAVEMR